MKNKKTSKLSGKANGMKFEISFNSEKAAERFYWKTKEELDDEKIPVGGKISYKRKGTKVIFKGNSIIAMDMLDDVFDD